MAKIAYVTNAPPLSGMGKPSREIFERIKGVPGLDADLFYIDAQKRILEKNGAKIAEVGELLKPLNLKPVQWWRLAKKLPMEGYDFWHLTNQSLSFIPRKKFLLTVYDLIELLEPQERFGGYAAQYLYRRLPSAKHVICVSEFTKKMVQETYGISDEKITVIPIGVSDVFKPVESVQSSIGYQELLRSYKLPKDAKIILYVGSDHARKNLILLAEIFAKVRTKIKNCYLIKVGEPGLIGGRIAFQNKLNALNLNDAVRFAGGVSEGELAMLYASSDVLVFPSLNEGFGVPPLEAMTSGCPVVCSNAASIPEVVGDAGLLHDPKDADAFTSSVIKILTDENYAAELSQKGLERSRVFAWEGIVEKTVEVYKRMMNND